MIKKEGTIVDAYGMYSDVLVTISIKASGVITAIV
jgi:hypothetical protein